VTHDPIDSGLRQILDAISDGVYVTTSDRRIVFWSAGAERITGYQADEVIGTSCADEVLVHTDLMGKRLCLEGCPLQECISTGAGQTLSEVFLKRKDGERLAVYVKTTVLETGGETYGVEIFGELESVAGKALAEQVQRLSDSAITDPLTGLFNRRYLDAALSQQYALYRRLGRHYGLIHIDVDSLKAVNDTLGHVVGDEAIRFVAGILSDNVRKMDLAARYGGDEFVVICAQTTPQGLSRYGRRIVRLVHDSRFAPAEEAGLRLTVSAGGAFVAPDDDDERAGLARADAAMYTAKRGGYDGFALDAAGHGE